MRTWISLVVLLGLGSGLLLSAQVPAPLSPKPDDPPPIVIRPKGAPTTVPEQDPPGKIIIRPKGSTGSSASPTLSTQPSPKSGTPSTTPSLPVQPQPPEMGEGKILFDYWYVAAVEGQRIGYLHWVGRELDKDGKKLWHGTKYQHFTVGRFGQVVTQWGEESTVETPDGEVLVTSMRQGLGPNQALALTGIVDGKTLRIKGQGIAEGAKDTPWPGGVTGVVREPHMFKASQVKVGETFDYLTYVPQVNRVVKVTTTFEAEETLTLYPNTPPRKLNRYVARMEPLQIDATRTFRLPPSITWCDPESGEPFLVAFDFPGLGGQVTFLRTTREAAMAPVGRVPDLFNVQSIRLDREIPGIHTRASVVYKVTMPRDDDPTTALAADFRQQVKNADPKAKTFELHVSASRGPVDGARAEPAPTPDFLGSNFFINWDNDTVKGHAARAVAGLGANASAWEKARAVERWVNQNMRAVEFSQAMTTADQVAKTLSGDCTEYAMLSAAMCRALGIPSRTALGLVYAPGRDGKPFLAYHMWFEVYANGQWLPLDATLGQGGVGPGHVKITDHSWHDEKSFAPLLPVLRVLMAKPGFEVISPTS